MRFIAIIRAAKEWLAGNVASYPFETTIFYLLTIRL